MPKKKAKVSKKQSSPASKTRAASLTKSATKAPARKKKLMGSGSLCNSGSGIGQVHPNHCKYFPKGQPVPVDVTLCFDTPLEGGNAIGRQQLNRPTPLIHAQSTAFACCWFSQAIDLGDESGNPAF